MSGSSTLWYFENFSLFDVLTTEDKIKIDSLAEMTNYGKKSVIYLQDAKPEKVYILKKGKVKISRYSDKGKELILQILNPGEIFGEASITGAPGNEYAEALEDSVICYLDGDVFRSFMEDNPEFNRQITKLIGFKLQKVSSQLESLCFKTSEERIRLFIKELALNENGNKNHNGTISANLKLTHEDIGKLTFTSRQKVTSILSYLEKNNIIRYNRKKIEILDIDRL
ncbi:MAG: Crp/Fnr family transcriptional regulator [Bacteroidota bacterium]